MCKLYIFGICQETLTLIIFEVFGFDINRKFFSTISNFFSFFLLACELWSLVYKLHIAFQTHSETRTLLFAGLYTGIFRIDLAFLVCQKNCRSVKLGLQIALHCGRCLNWGNICVFFTFFCQVIKLFNSDL